MSDEVRYRFMNDALFHARVKTTRRMLDYENPGSRWDEENIAVILDADDRVSTASRSTSIEDPLFGDPSLDRALRTAPVVVVPSELMPDA